jgi:hypothetical protein
VIKPVNHVAQTVLSFAVGVKMRPRKMIVYPLHYRGLVDAREYIGASEQLLDAFLG